jgi:hypothetical protein
MSTDILKYSKIPGTNSYEEDYSKEALLRYVSITLPLMAVTFLAWWVLYWWVNKKQEMKVLKDRLMNRHRLSSFV